MQKFGRVRFAGTDSDLAIVWTSYGMDLERIEVLKSLSQYSPIDTSSCLGAYYKKSRELFFGNEDYIKTIQSIKSAASIFKGKMEQTIEPVPEGLKMVQEKSDLNLGLKYKIVLINGLITYEYYEDAGRGCIELTSILKDNGSDIQPINLSLYHTYDVVDDVVMVSEGTAEYYSEEYLRAKYPLDHIDEEDYVVVQDYLTADARLKEWIEAPTELKAVDLETTGKETGMFGKDCITGVVMAYSEHDSTYYPFRQEKCEFNLPIGFLTKIIEAINNQPKNVKILAHNGKFEKEGVQKEHPDYIRHSPYAVAWKGYDPERQPTNVDLRIDADTYILSVLVHPKLVKGLHTLKTRALEATGNFYLDLDLIFKGEIKFNVLPPEIIRLYACPDAPNTIKVYKYLMSKLPKDEIKLFEAIESPLVDVKACNEFYGMRIDKAKLVKLIENEEYKVKLLGDMFRNIHHTTKNIQSPQVLRDIFYNKLRCPVDVKTDTGLPSTSAEAVKRIVELGVRTNYDKDNISPSIYDLFGKEIVKGIDLTSNRYPSLVILAAYNKAKKELGALKRIERKSLKDRVMFGINQVGAESGRQTSDAHQYSDAMKSLIMADSSQHYLWSADFKQIELRILAYLAGQKDLIEKESNPSIDIHRAVLSIITGKEEWAITAKERSDGKSVNFGVVYMMSKFGLAKKKAGPKCTKADLIEAENSITGFYNGLPQIKAFVKHNEEFIKENGFIKTKFGRYRYFPEVLDPTISERTLASKVRAGNNTPVQGFGADYLKQVENNINAYIKEKGWDKKVECDGNMLPMVRLMLPIHDEVLVSTHKSINIMDIIIMFKTCMEMKIEGAPPFFSGPAMVDNWALGKEDKYEIPIEFRDEAIAAYEKDGTCLIHPETYLKDLNGYRNRILREYMDDLVRRFKTVDEITKNVKHPDLTHVLISRYITKDETKVNDHIQCIHIAVERYMDDAAFADAIKAIVSKYGRPVDAVPELSQTEYAQRLVEKILKKDEIQRLSNEEAVTKALLKFIDEGGLVSSSSTNESEKADDERERLCSYEELEQYIEFDDNGEVILDEDEEVSEEVDDVETLKREEDYLNYTDGAYAIYMLQEVLIDLTDLDMDEAEVAHQRISELSTADSAYRVLYLLRGKEKPIVAPFRIGYDPAKVKSIIEEIRGGK